MLLDCCELQCDQVFFHEITSDCADSHSCTSEDPIRIIEGPIPTTVVCCHSNATACIYEYFTGQLLANATGHSELLTGAAVVGGGSYLATSGTDGCIFIWKIKKEILHAALATSRKEGVASETGLMAPICEEMRSKLPKGAGKSVWSCIQFQIKCFVSMKVTNASTGLPQNSFH